MPPVLDIPWNMLAGLDSSRHDVFTLKASVCTGFEQQARDEVAIKLRSVAYLARGRIFFDVKACHIDKAFELRSVDHIDVVMAVQESLGFTNDEELCRSKLMQLPGQFDWTKCLLLAQKIAGFSASPLTTSTATSSPSSETGAASSFDGQKHTDTEGSDEPTSDKPGAVDTGEVKVVEDVTCRVHVSHSVNGEGCQGDSQTSSSVGLAEDSSCVSTVSVGENICVDAVSVTNDGGTVTAAGVVVESNHRHTEVPQRDTSAGLTAAGGNETQEMSILLSNSGCPTDTTQHTHCENSSPVQRLNICVSGGAEVKADAGQLSPGVAPTVVPVAGDAEPSSNAGCADTTPSTDGRGVDGSGDRTVVVIDACDNNNTSTEPEHASSTADSNVESSDTSSIRQQTGEAAVPSFRATCFRSGGCGGAKKHVFTSQTASAWFGGAVHDKFGWRVQMKRPDIEVVLSIDDDTATVAIVLTQHSLSNRNMIKLGPTTLRSTVCFNMLMLARPKPWEIVLDPLCGSGSISLEGVQAFPGSYHLCGDNHHESGPRTLLNQQHCQQQRQQKQQQHQQQTIIKGARGCSARQSEEQDSINNCDSSEMAAENSNTEPKSTQSPPVGFSMDVVRWDACHLPLLDSVADVVVSDLPFGKRLGSVSSNARLYPLWLEEMARVCCPRYGRAVLLTQDKKSMDKALNRPSVRQMWRVRIVPRINIGGLLGCVYVLARSDVLVRRRARAGNSASASTAACKQAESSEPTDPSTDQPATEPLTEKVSEN